LTGFNRAATRLDVQMSFRMESKSDDLSLTTYKYMSDGRFEGVCGKFGDNDTTYLFFAEPRASRELKVQNIEQLAQSCFEPADKFAILSEATRDKLIEVVTHRARLLFGPLEEEKEELFQPLEFDALNGVKTIAVLPKGADKCWFADTIGKDAERKTLNVRWFDWCEKQNAFVITDTGYRSLSLDDVVGTIKHVPISVKERVAFDNAVLATWKRKESL
jgi:hypothetical protein